MLQLFYSNRYETLVGALLDDLAQAPSDPWAAQPVIVPSAAVRRRLELDIATRQGICANVNFGYLAQWLWAQIGGVIEVPQTFAVRAGPARVALLPAAGRYGRSAAVECVAASANLSRCGRRVDAL